MKSASQNIISHVTLKQYMEEAVHSKDDMEMQHIVDVPQKKKEKTTNNNVVPDKNKKKVMMSKEITKMSS